MIDLTEGNRLGPISKAPMAEILGVFKLMSIVKKFT